MTSNKILLSAAQLIALQNSGAALMVFDCTSDLMQPALGQQQYEAEHIAGAVFADLNTALSAKGDPAVTGAMSGGRHPLPSREAFAAWLGSVGFNNGMQAVAYDRNGTSYAGRLWWMLQWLGHSQAAVLDGGLAAWKAAGGAVSSGIETPFSKTNYAFASTNTSLLATKDLASQLGRPTQTIIDARAAPRFKGEVEPMDPVAGHIPGALNRPFTMNFNADGTFKNPAVLKAEFDALLAGRDPATVVHHCGSGVTANANLMAMELAGLGRAALYAGSWSEWCSDRARPVAQSQ